jgi:hypothetical protein
MHNALNRVGRCVAATVFLVALVSPALAAESPPPVASDAAVEHKLDALFADEWERSLRESPESASARSPTCWTTPPTAAMT